MVLGFIFQQKLNEQYSRALNAKRIGQHAIAIGLYEEILQNEVIRTVFSKRITHFSK